MNNRSLVILKPDALHRDLFGDFCDFIASEDIEIDEYEYIKNPSTLKINSHYEDHLENDWYPKLLNHMKAGPIIVMALTSFHSNEPITHIKKACDSYKLINMINTTYNTIHASESPEHAIRELKIWGLYP